MKKATSLFAILLAFVLAACDDVSPVDYRPSPPQDASVPDAIPSKLRRAGNACAAIKRLAAQSTISALPCILSAPRSRHV